ncbi:MAG: hypothetical protein KAS98_16145, partial [Deltaproteobacteria bacterium]|nr:hypothetical protein [Deltaproteobacteria bacterium]
EKKNISLEDIYQGTVELVSRSLQYPEITCVRVNMEGKEFRTENFKETIWKLTVDISVYGKPDGVLEICYLEERPECDYGPFLVEEKVLIDTVAERLGKITERKQAEEAILKSEQRFRNLIKNSPTGITIIQKDKVVYSNPAQSRMTDALFDPSLSIALENIHPDDVEIVTRNYQKLISGMKKHIDMEFRFYPAGKKADRLDIKWVHCMASVIDYQGKEAIILNLMDVTIVKELNHILRTQDKMTSLGRVATGIAHEIRNPLAGINLFVDILHDKEKFAQTDRETEILNEIKDNVNRMAGMIKRLVNFANPSAKTKENIDINALIREGINLWSAKFIEAEINSELSLGDDILLVSGDSIELQQAIDNLVKNALEVMEKGGILGISTTEGMSSFHKNREVVIIKIKDTGPGIKPEDKGSIFNPFFTTKHTSAGLGLAISHQIIARHGGTISCESEPGEGTTFTIELPCVSAKNSGASPQSE